jgi:hypothetical protein
MRSETRESRLNKSAVSRLPGGAIPSPVTVRAIQSNAITNRGSSQLSSRSAQPRLPCKQSTVPEGVPVKVNCPSGVKAWSIRYEHAVEIRLSSSRYAPN